jgi:hypothetical protein
MKTPKEVLSELNKKFNRHRGTLLTEILRDIETSLLPIDIPVFNLSEEKILEIGLDQLIEWSTLWRESSLWPYIRLRTKNWKFGKQEIPQRFVITNVNDYLTEIDQLKLFLKVKSKAKYLISCHPKLISVIGKHWNYLCSESDADIHIMCNVLTWFIKNNNSSLYERQIPIKGLHTKWLEKRRKTVKGLLKELLSSDKDDYYSLTGIKRKPHRIRIRILCSDLRNKVGGLCDIESSLTEISQLSISPKRVVIMENLITGLSLKDMKSTVVIFRLGYSVREVAKLNWIKSVKELYYWGDLDTNGMNMLGLLRTKLPVISILMDRETLDQNTDFLSVEKDIKQINPDFQFTHSEKAIYEHLIQLSNKELPNRLEQEFIPWINVLSSLD